MSPASIAAAPRLAFLTDRPGSWAFGRIGPALLQGFEELGYPFDLVYLKGSRGIRCSENIREVGLGDVHARNAVFAVARYLHRVKPDLTVASPAHVIPAALLAGKLTGRTVVPWEHTFLDLDMPELPLRMHGLPLLLRASYPLAPAVAIAADDLEPYVRKLAPQLGPNRIFRLPSPIDLEAAIRGARDGESYDRRAPGLSIVTSGRLQEQKGHDLLIEALRQAQHDLPPDWTVTIVGEGSRRPALEHQAAAAGLSDHAAFVGHQENPLPFIKKADIFILPSRWEGCPVALLEALALGRPCIGTAGLGGVAETLGHGEYGVVTPAEDPRALSQAIVAMAQNDEMRRAYSRVAVQRAQDFKGERIAASILAMSDSLAGR